MHSAPTDTVPGVAIRVARHYEGPPGTTNGGWACGLAAGLLTGPGPSWGTAVEVTLRAPVPLEIPIRGERTGDSAFLTAGADRLAEARLLTAAETEALAPPPGFVPLDEARRAGAPEVCVPTPFPGCYVCGDEREGGLRIRVGPVWSADDGNHRSAGEDARFGDAAWFGDAGGSGDAARSGGSTARFGDARRSGDATRSGGAARSDGAAAEFGGAAQFGGAARSGDAGGMRTVRGGPIDGGGRVAGVWVPPSMLGDLPPRYVWAALDCPTGLVHLTDGGKALLGRLTVVAYRMPVPGEPLVVVAAATGTERRKRFATAGLYTGDGVLVAHSVAVWIAI